MSEQETETKICPGEDCPAYGYPQPLGNFYTGRQGGRVYHQKLCKKCANKQRSAALKAKAVRDQADKNPEPEPVEVEAAKAEKPCVHIWICGDDYIRRTLPGFFDTHEPAPRGYEWQVCRWCDTAKQVMVFNVSEFADSNEPAPTPEEFRPALTVSVGEQASEAVAGAARTMAGMAQALKVAQTEPEPVRLPLKNDRDEVVAEVVADVVHYQIGPDTAGPVLQPKVFTAITVDPLAEALKRVQDLEAKLAESLAEKATLARDNLTLRSRIELAEAEADLHEVERRRERLLQEISRLREIVEGRAA